MNSILLSAGALPGVLVPGVRCHDGRGPVVYVAKVKDGTTTRPVVGVVPIDGPRRPSVVPVPLDEVRLDLRDEAIRDRCLRWLWSRVAPDGQWLVGAPEWSCDLPTGNVPDEEDEGALWYLGPDGDAVGFAAAFGSAESGPGWVAVPALAEIERDGTEDRDLLALRACLLAVGAR